MEDEAETCHLVLTLSGSRTFQGQAKLPTLGSLRHSCPLVINSFFVLGKLLFPATGKCILTGTFSAAWH